MTGFEPRTSGIGSDRSTNWATTTARFLILCQLNSYLTISLYQSMKACGKIIYNTFEWKNMWSLP